MSTVSGRAYRTLRIGGVGQLGAIIKATQLVAPERDAVFPAWQGMQYMRDMFAGRVQLQPLDNDRYPDLVYTRLPQHLAGLDSPGRPGMAQEPAAAALQG